MVRVEQQVHKNPWSLPTFLLEFSHPDKMVFVARLPDDELLGYICGWAIADEAQLHNVAVAGNWQGCGLAWRLLDKFIAEARRRDVVEVVLEVRASNGSAIRLYEGYGFQTVGHRQNYYDHPKEDAYIMKMATGNKSNTGGQS